MMSQPFYDSGSWWFVDAMGSVQGPYADQASALKLMRKYGDHATQPIPLTLKALIVGIGLGLLAALGLGSVKGEESHEHMSEAGKFYSTWKKPNWGGERFESCCNNDDCFRTQVVIRDGKCMAWKPAWATVEAHWVVFNCGKMEENQKDPRESPDGESHACIAKYSDTVYCAVRGSGS